MNKQLEKFKESDKARIIDWILDGLGIFQDDIEYVGDWIYISVYLPDAN